MWTFCVVTHEMQEVTQNAKARAFRQELERVLYTGILKERGKDGKEIVNITLRLFGKGGGFQSTAHFSFSQPSHL